MITLITGGVKSGKSRFALKLTENKKDKFFIATAEPIDDEMKAKIEKHKLERKGEFTTIEEPIYLAKAISNIQNAQVCIIDCLNIWVNNLLYYDKLDQIEELLKLLKNFVKFELIFVSNEVGMGLLPADKLSRHFVNLLGNLNQQIAAMSDAVYFMVSGLPLKIK
ncbi:bifunctional adenosylcobinamide kinase/adenosylcobinamide-phosphate guanylyltransferase [Hippea alviniae]|uniref:bifunctional adenosylcobinamide kinase/adenosylcobinamide-phosphate guanylyltransferase n=1 Tax=Hippea alviniae TaxID=1279027 RepID=UPI0003B3379C|nr:bifunctional adenosylcobinamide kinase/adenosylcobinamide-phosphate guanylyltransferase [Hippea alviniae]